MTAIYAYINCKELGIDDTAWELLAAARKISADAGVTAIVTGSGAEVDKAAADAAVYYDKVIKCNRPELSYPNAETVRLVLEKVVPEEAVLLATHDTFGMDLCPGLSIRLDAAYVADVVDIEGLDGSVLKVVRQEYGGQVSTHVTCDISTGAVLTVRPGAFVARDLVPGKSVVEDRSIDTVDLTSRRTFIKLVAAEKGEVDITRSEVLVSIGRGIEDQDNIEIAHDLADALGAAVSCSRPIVDAKWLEKSRQVGTSGQTVKPKVYLACGISGSFQHMGGIKGSPLIVAINKNPRAPIFQVADVGIQADILEFMPQLTEAIRAGG